MNVFFCTHSTFLKKNLLWKLLNIVQNTGILKEYSCVKGGGPIETSYRKKIFFKIFSTNVKNIRNDEKKYCFRVKIEKNLLRQLASIGPPPLMLRGNFIFFCC